MRYLVLAAALAFTASPALGQVRRELPQWAGQGDAWGQPSFPPNYDLDWDAPQKDTKDVRWKPILVGAATGFTLGFGYGWWLDENRSGSSGPCIVSSSDPHGPCLNDDPSPYEIRMVLGLNGLLMGGIVGWIWALIEAGAD